MDVKIIGHGSDGINTVITFSDEQFHEVLAECAYYGIDMFTPQFANVVLDFVSRKKYKALRKTTRTPEQLKEELRRNYPDGLMQILPKEENNG